VPLLFLDVKAVRIQKYLRTILSYFIAYRVQCKFSILLSDSCFAVRNAATENLHMAHRTSRSDHFPFKS